MSMRLPKLDDSKEEQIKRCPTCDADLPSSSFHKDKTTKDGLCSQCKVCKRKYIVRNIDKQKAYLVGYRKKNACRIYEYHKSYGDKHREAISDYQKRYYQQNKDRISLRNSKSNRLNKEKINYRKRQYFNNNLNARIASRLRSRLYNSLKKQLANKRVSAVDNLGCTVEYLIQHLEGQFKPGMNWGNYGFVWHIDHVYPLSLFDLSKCEEQAKAVHYSNLQPLFVEENLSKGASLDWSCDG